LNTTEIRAGIERYERVQQEESARKDRRALWFSICALLGSIALVALEVALQFGEHYLPTIFRPSNLTLGSIETLKSDLVKASGFSASLEVLSKTDVVHVVLSMARGRTFRTPRTEDVG
jgi:hypothetical protein